MNSFAAAGCFQFDSCPMLGWMLGWMLGYKFVGFMGIEFFRVGRGGCSLLLGQFEPP
jgi:hypothetical protein